MDTKCPLCNAFTKIKENCPWCQVLMEDQGPVEDFFEPYSPYIAREEAKMKNIDSTKCVHLFSCPKCGYDKRITVKEIFI